MKKEVRVHGFGGDENAILDFFWFAAQTYAKIQIPRTVRWLSKVKKKTGERF